MNEGWISYKDLRDKLSPEQVLLHYQVKPSIKGVQHHGFCPLPTHDGKGKSPSFSMNMEKKIFQCFGCQATGNILEFAIRMEGGDPQDKREFTRLSRKVHDVFVGYAPARTEPIKAKEKEAPVETQEPSKKVLINHPLDFTLKELDSNHPYLLGRGFNPETIAHFGIGFCARGLMKDRIAIPLKSNDGQLIGYAGRTINGTDPKSETPRYMFPAPRERESVLLEFHKGLFVYNLNSIKEPLHEVIIVEGFTSVWWLYQHRFLNCGALMGSSCSEEQAEIIISKTRPDGVVLVMPDGDPSGIKCAGSVFNHIGGRRLCKLIKLRKDAQPTDCDGPELQKLLVSEVAPPTVAIPLKTRVISNRITPEAGVLELGQSFPVLLPHVTSSDEWNPTSFDARMANTTNGLKSAAQFLLHVVDPHRTWLSGSFDGMASLKTWGHAERKAYAKWVQDPWWCEGNSII